MFSLGQVAATPAAIEAMKAAEQSPAELLHRYVSGDWGDVPPEDAKEHDLSVRERYRILSAYMLSTGIKIWVLTEADNSETTFSLPEEY